MTPTAESALRDAAFGGDGAAWRMLYDSASADVIRYVRWRCGGKPDWTEDAVQETWQAAAKAICRFDPEKGAFAGWVCGFASNVVRNRLRFWKRHDSKLGPLTDDMTEKTRNEPDVETALRVAETLYALPEPYERVLREKYLDGRSVAEIADLSGESIKTIESRLTRAREAFRTAFASEAIIKPAPGFVS